MQSLGTVPAATPADVAKAIAACRVASREWARSSFAQRRALMRVLLKYTVDNQETICRCEKEGEREKSGDCVICRERERESERERE